MPSQDFPDAQTGPLGAATALGTEQRPHPLGSGPGGRKPSPSSLSILPAPPTLPFPAKRGVGRPRKLSPEEQAAKRAASKTFYQTESTEVQKDRATRWQRRTFKTARDIAPLPTDRIDWTRRKACAEDLKLFNRTYLPNTFNLPWSEDQLRCIQKAETVVKDGGQFALAMPRGGGKTAICRSTILWATLNAYRFFAFFIGSKHTKALKTLEFCKTTLFRSELFQQDYPEICYPILRLEGRHHLASGQLYRDQPTHIEWGSDEVHFPSLLLEEEVAEVYNTHLPGFLAYSDIYKAWFSKSAATIISTSGIEGSIRGEAGIHPILLQQPRPDLVLLDDIQKDQDANSPISCEKIINLIDGAILGLAGPSQKIACLMPCTITREGDVSSVFLDRAKRPDWNGECCSMVIQWPDGITEDAVLDETEAGRLWNEYAEARTRSYRLHGDIRLATEFYASHREAMDNGFIVSWEHRYNQDEISAQQHAMDLRLKAPLAFRCEYQNKPKRLGSDVSILITPMQFRERIAKTEQGLIPLGHDITVAWMDVQDEILFWLVFACSRDFSGVVIDYGTWPEEMPENFTKTQAQNWRLLSNRFFTRYPEQRGLAERSGNRYQAPLEAKIYNALEEAVAYLRGKVYMQESNTSYPFRLNKIGIDTRWGLVTSVVKNFCRGQADLIPYFGHPVAVTQRQFEEYTRTKGWLFEDQVNPRVKSVKWIWRPDPDGQYRLMVDVSRMKDFLFSRLSCPVGSSGAITVYQAPPEHHALLSEHICNSEYPEPITARGITKNQWKTRDNNQDNDWLDCLVGCLAIASKEGAGILLPEEDRLQVRKRRLSDIWKRKLETNKSLRGT